jgi:TonB-linked SusC/RagA family outer membrane protein
VPDITKLDEVVVIGYGKMKKSDLTGSVSSVKGDDIASAGSASFSQALQGRAAGVSVTSTSGTPGGGSTIRIRGMGSINSGNDPLYVVDGMPIGAGPNTADLINPDDIESVEVLKDASAAAIYGSQGANGVILVTTKRGKSGAPKLSFDSYFGTKSIPKTWDPGDAAQFGEVYLLAEKASGAQIGDINDYYKPYYSMLNGVDFTKDYSTAQKTLYNKLKEDHPESTNWLNELYRKGQVQNYNVSLSGGNDVFRYVTSISYYKESGIIKTTDYDRMTFRLNSDYIVSKKLKLGSNITLVNSGRDGINPLISSTVTGGLNPGSDNSLFSQAYEIDPVTQVKRTVAETILAGGNPSNPYDMFSAAMFTGTPNPAAGLARTNLQYSQFQLLGNAFAEYSILSGLVFKSSIGINFSKGLEDSFYPDYYISGQDRNLINSVKRINDGSNSWDWINQLTYIKSIGKHSITLMGAIDASRSLYESITATKSNTPSDDINLQYLHDAQGVASADDNIDENALLSYLGRLNYSYANKYLLTATFRRDGSSKFSEDTRWGDFKSFSAAYKVSEESYFKNLDIRQISNLKFRVGWGQLGNAAIPSYQNVSLYNATSQVTYPFGPATAFPGGQMSNYVPQPLSQGAIPTQIGNPMLQWETQEQTNVGLDIGLFKDKISFTADYFIRTSKNNLLQMPVPPNVGYATELPYTNAGEIENRGFEFTGDMKNNIGDFSYRVEGNISFTKNKVLSLGSLEQYPHAGTRVDGIPWKTVVGNSIAEFYGYQTEGIFQTQEEIDNYKGPNGTVLQPNARPGDFKFANTQNDNVLNDADKTYLGSPLPKFTYGFNVSLSYKGWDLDMFFQGQYGNKIFMYEKYFIYRGQGNFNSIEGLPDMAWHGPGTSNTQPRISADDPNNNFRMSNYYLEDGSYLKLKTIQLGYNLPKNICSMLKIANAKFFVSGENALLFTKFPGIDPEIASSNINSMGMSSFQYPAPKTFRVGIKVGF